MFQKVKKEHKQNTTRDGKPPVIRKAKQTYKQ